MKKCINRETLLGTQISFLILMSAVGKKWNCLRKAGALTMSESLSIPTN
jgi:hypothetical protein